MILDPREGERDAVRKVREYYKESNDIQGTLRRLPHNMVAERAVLQCLKKLPRNYVQALKAIPRTSRMMYIHSYQSYLWNHAASSRVQKYGADRVVVGDLVYCKDGSINVVSSTHSDCEMIYVKNLTVVAILMSFQKLIFLMKRIFLSREFSVTSISGGYRRVFQKPVDFEWEILKYTDASTPLADTDLDILTKSKSTNNVQKEDPTNGSKVNSVDSISASEDCNTMSCGIKAEIATQCSDSEAAQTALKLSFTLPASCYATMAIRELLKTSTSATSVFLHDRLPTF